jgi:hypothetical protein
MSDIDYKQGDTIPVRANLPIDLSTASSLFFEIESNFGDFSLSKEATILDPAAGEVSYSFSDGETDQAGPYKMEWRVEWQDGQTQTFPQDGYDELYIHEDV